MIVAPSSLVRQEEGVQGEEEEEARGRRRLGSIVTTTPGADAPTGPTRSDGSDARNRRKHGRWCGVPSLDSCINAVRIFIEWRREDNSCIQCRIPLQLNCKWHQKGVGSKGKRKDEEWKG